ncbi:MAG: ribose 5-phosphate isomerase B [Bacteroidales bacterium]|jgi:ribose 5-phosphate isomerase B|nr:ribose 5-phosphate isomerase B [Bacteroidales bacterium]
MISKRKISIAIASDHAGFAFKELLKDYLEKKGYSIRDFGTDSDKSADYPDFAHPLAEAVEAGEFTYGITLCGSGNGISMTANKHQGIRSALCWNKEIAQLARLHNDANVCSLPARYISYELAQEIVQIFLNTDFEGGRHQRRIAKIPVQ